MRRLFLLVVALGLLAAGCGGDDGGVSVDGQWARNSPKTASAGAVYMNLTSDAADALIGASVDSSIADRVEVHEVVPVEGSEDAEEGMAAMMMQPVSEIALPEGETVNLKPGGYHIMLLDIAAPLEIGQKFDVTIKLKNGGEKVVEVEVREEAP